MLYADNHFLLFSIACQFLLVTSIHLGSSHNNFTMAEDTIMGYFSAEKDLKLKAQMGKKNMSANVPGSKGHSLSLANSAGVFPVRTQLELRSIIGILQENQLHFYIRFRQKNMKSHLQDKNHAEQTGENMFKVIRTRASYEKQIFPLIPPYLIEHVA